MTIITPVFVDWVTAVAPDTKHGMWLRYFLGNEVTTACQRAYHRERGVEYYPSQAKHYFTPNDLSKGSIIVMDGSCLGNMRRDHDNDWSNKVVALLARCSDHFSRVDLTVDIMDEGYFARKIARETVEDRMDWGRRKATVVQGQGLAGGTTTYVGSRTSPVYFRCYDKAAESKGKILASRLEFELKAEHAVGVSKSLSDMTGWLNVTGLFTRYLREISDWTGHEEIVNIIYGDVQTVDIKPRERLMGQKEWLERQVFPTFLKHPNTTGLELWQWMKERIETGLAIPQE